MIKEINRVVYYSTVLDKMFRTKEAAEQAEAKAIMQVSVKAEYVKNLVDQFHKYRNEIDNEDKGINHISQEQLDLIIKSMLNAGVDKLDISNENRSIRIHARSKFKENKNKSIDSL